VQPPKNTGTETGRDEIDSESDIETAKPFAPTEDWIKQYEKQATPKLIAGLNQYAPRVRSPSPPPDARSTTTTRVASCLMRSAIPGSVSSAGIRRSAPCPTI
jgi:hypothetical protein